MTEKNTKKISISFIVPVYNRPDEIRELLDSLTKQTLSNFEVVIVEDGSQLKCDSICENFKDQLTINYYFKDNSGPGLSRNYGFERAEGNYCIFLDSDCILPPGYFEFVYQELQTNYVDAFGGPDRAHESFTRIQKAINYSMTSFLTTGGIRGNSEKLGKFVPRSFNMGYSREVFNTTKGFSKMRFGEDIDMSTRIVQNGFTTGLIKEAYVYHKRRTKLRQFYKQVHNSGIARINLFIRHPKSLKIVHFAPSLFIMSLLLLIMLAVIVSVYFLVPIGLHILLIFIDSSIKNKSIAVGLTSILSSYIQLFSYGLGFLGAFWNRIILRKREYSAFQKNFYQ